MTWLRPLLLRLYTRRMLKERQTELLMRKADLVRAHAAATAYVEVDAQLVAVMRERIRRGWL